MKKKTLILLDRLSTLFLWIVFIVALYVAVQLFFLASFRVPSSSMEPGIVAGDHILVTKPVMGARLFNVYSAAEGKPFTIHRLPGIGSVKRNDVLVFNYPFSHKKDSISFDLMTYYVKRCIALPGDTLDIRDAYFAVRGVDEPLGYLPEQEALQRVLSDRKLAKKLGVVLSGYPRDRQMGWNIKEFGPYYIPRKGAVISMNRENAILYRPVIEWEEQKSFRWQDDGAFLDGKEITSYTFKKNYYFVSGDKILNSKDSRYWGVLPEDFIVGKATLIWKSIDPNSGEWRWDRFLKRIK